MGNSQISHGQSTIPSFLYFAIAFTTLFLSIAPHSHAQPDSHPENSFSNSLDIILINCGSSETVHTEYGRAWVGDHPSKFTPLSSSTISATAASPDPSLPSQLLYMTARLFTEKAMYKIPLSRTSERQFLRLHMYPSTYDGRDAADAFFSVTCGSHALLRNFSALAKARALNQAYLVMEFSIPVASQQLDIIFAPESTNPKSYAFVNAIEVITTSNLLFKNPAALLPSQIPVLVPIGLNTALQNMYRLNAGGQFISSGKDKYGRTWEDDSLYIFGANVGGTGSLEPGSKITYSDADQAFVFAPEEVYGSYRSMNWDSKQNLRLNLTWILTVDSNFSYLVRLHFCELQFTKENQRTFDIYVNNQTAEQGFDVVAVARGPNRPIYRDYEVYIPAEASGPTDLWIALYPNKTTEPQYYNAILNGLEIFKLNDSSGNLAGPNPTVTQEIAQGLVKEASSTSNNSRKEYIIGGLSGTIAVAILLLIVFFVRQRKNKEQVPCHTPQPFLRAGVSTITSEESVESAKFSGSYISISVPAMFCRYFSLAEIQEATCNFDESLLLGAGGFGRVYKGVIDGGAEVAVKRASPESQQGLHEFRNEIELLSRLRHKHLVSLIGYCVQNSEMCLVYDYVPNGTLDKHLYGRDGKNKGGVGLPWKKRVEICIGAAKGLDYLHLGAFQTVIHRDVKSSNILLDHNLNPKVSDFGLSKTMGQLDQTHVTTLVKGSFGYMDPQYFYRQALTQKSDVYSFGVVLFEVLCAKPAVMSAQSGEKINLSEWAFFHLREGALERIVDPSLMGDITAESLEIFAELGQKCLAEEGEDRPSMTDVVWHLEFALHLHETSKCKGEIIESVKPDGKISLDMANYSVNMGCESGMRSEGEEPVAIFSQLGNPRGK